MSGSLVIGKLFGIKVRVHFSWLFIFFLVAWSLADSLFPDLYPDWSSSVYWIVGILGSVFLFLSVLLHELSHSLLAISRGHKVKGITLFILGGVSEIEGEARRPGEEFWIAFVGPLTSFILAGVFGLVILLAGDANEQVQALSSYLATVNLLLGVFNLIPGYPLDGGRVLRAILWRTTGSLSRATQAAARVGVVVGFVFMGVGVVFAFTGSLVGGLWLIFVGWFLSSVASTSRQQETLRARLSGLKVRDALRPGFPAVIPGLSVQQLVEEHVTKGFERAYLVILGDTLHGLVSITDVGPVPAQDRGTKYVTEIMTRTSELVTVGPDDPLEMALQRMATGNYHQLPVMENGRPIGLVTRGDVLRVFELANMVGPGQDDRDAD